MQSSEDSGFRESLMKYMCREREREKEGERKESEKRERGRKERIRRRGCCFGF